MKRIAIVLMSMLVACGLMAGCASQVASSGSSSTSADASSTSASSSASESSAAAASSSAKVEAEHSIEVTLQGGSGRATVESPAQLNIAADGSMTAVIVWSSPHYDLMVVDGVEYWPVPRPGNSTFEIPVTALDVDLPIQAETTAMSEPHMIDYTLHFDSSTMK